MGLQTWVSSGLGLVADVYRVPSCARPRDGQELGSSKLNKATVALGAKINPWGQEHVLCAQGLVCASHQEIVVKSLTG